MADNHPQVFVLSERSLFRLWLIDKLDNRVLTAAEAEAKWREYQERGKFVGGLKSTGDDLVLMRRLAADMRNPLGRVYFKNYGGKPHIIFKGRPGLRRIMTGTRYSVKNAKVISMGLGRAGIKANVRGGSFVSIFILSAFNIADFVIRDEMTLGQFIGVMATDIAKVAISGAISFAAGAAVVGTVVGTFALGPLVVAVAVGFVVGLALDRLDNKFRITQKLQRYLDIAIPKVEAWLKTQGNQIARGVRNVATEVGNAYDSATTGVGRAYDNAMRAGAGALRDMEREILRVQWRILSQF